MSDEVQTKNLDRPRQGANRSGAGSPITQQRVREVYSMTDVVQGGTEWVPRFGKLDGLPAEHAAVIRGLFELAAFVADHPELPAPTVRAVFFPPYGGDEASRYAARRSLVDSLALAVGAQPRTSAGGTHYDVSAQMGPVEVTSFAITPEHMAQHDALMSYADNVQPGKPSVAAAGGVR